MGETVNKYETKTHSGGSSGEEKTTLQQARKKMSFPINLHGQSVHAAKLEFGGVGWGWGGWVSESESHSVVSNSLRPHTVHGILQVRILELVAFPFSKGSSQPRDRTQVSCMAGGFFTSWATRWVSNSETICFKETWLGAVMKYFPRCLSGPIAGKDR